MFLRTFDNWLFDAFFQPWSEDFQEATKHTQSCFLLAVIFILLSWLCFVVNHFTTGYLPGKDRASVLVGWFLFGYVSVMYTGFAGYLLRRNKRFRESTHTEMAMNYMRISVYFTILRVTFGAFAIVVGADHLPFVVTEGSLHSLCAFLMYLFLWVAMYFASCTPKPPSYFKDRLLLPAMGTA